MEGSDMCATNRIFLLTGELSRRLEIDAEISEFTLVVFADVLDSVDVEGYSKAVDREHDGLCFSVNEDLHRYKSCEWTCPHHRFQLCRDL